MPTVGWIQESAIDRISDAFPFVKQREEPVLCQLCGRFFFDGEKLRTHLGVDHPLKQPVLKIGREIGTQFIVRDRSTLESVEVFHTTSSVLVEGIRGPRELSPEALKDELLHVTRNTQYKIILKNERALDGRVATVEITVEVAIPDPELCAAVEALFEKYLTVDAPTFEAVSHFLREAPDEPAVKDYAGALADYVLGLLIKEQNAVAGTVVAFSTFKDKFGSARRVLNHFHRPLAKVVLAAIDFNLNNFWPHPQLSVPLLESGHRFFACFRSPGHQPEWPGKSPKLYTPKGACPVDHLSSEILTLVESFPGGSATDIGAGRYPISEFDRPKIEILLAAKALLAADKSRALQHLRRLAHDYHFGAWATKQIENLAGNE